MLEDQHRRKSEMTKVKRGSLRIVEIATGFALYGENEKGEEVMVAYLGDGKQNPLQGDPNDQAAARDLAGAYDFEFLDETEAA